MSTETAAEATALPGDVWCIDTEQMRPNMAACYLIGDGERYAFVEAGTNHGVPALLARLDALGIGRHQISHVIPTHVHLDHAGGAGLLMRELPQAQLVVHPRGARHMIDPSALWKGVTAVYGADNAQRMYGELVPVPADRVVAAETGHEIRVGERLLTVMDSPGHARHHFSIWDEQTRGWFTGDTFGLSYRDFDTARGPFILPTTTPVQFEPEAWAQTIDAYMARDPQRMYLTHYSVVEDVARLADELRAGLQDYVSIAQSLKDSSNRHAALVDALTAHAMGRLRQHGCGFDEAHVLELMGHDFDLNAQGLEVWLDKLA
jgi:glyoxylase-like metal-dependent hydrolase (beta-lactamase superfamily II)